MTLSSGTSPPPGMTSLWKTQCVLLGLLAFASMMHQVEAQRGGASPFNLEDCIGSACCETTKSETWRGMSCAMYASLDDDPLLQMEGCAKHGEGCKTICRDTPDLRVQYADCDKKYNKDTVYADWWGCFRTAMVAALIKSSSNANQESIPPENVTDNFCNLLSQPGCPMCIKMRWGSPCSNPLIKAMCRKQCKSCLCPAPNPFWWQASALSCKKSGLHKRSDEDGGGFVKYSAYADTCTVTCPVDTSSSSLLRCEHGGWIGATSDPTCMKNCDNTGITLPAGGSKLTRTGLKTDGCSSLLHNEKCKLSCGAGTTASAYWQCYNGEIKFVQGTTPTIWPPMCLKNCGAPPVPWKASKFGECSNVVLDDPDGNFESAWSSNVGYEELKGTKLTMDVTVGGDQYSTSTSPLRDQLTEAGVFDKFAETCSVLKDENKNDPANDKFEWRRLSEFSRRLEQNDEDTNATIFVPPNTPSGSGCTLECEHPFAPTGGYYCWDGVWTVPKCTVRLFHQGIQWPVDDGSVVSYLGSVYATYNLEVIMPSLQNMRTGSNVTVCAGEGTGCPTGKCFTKVPVEDGGRITTQGSQLRVRLSCSYEEKKYGCIEEEQRYGCPYEVTIPEGTVVAIEDRTVANPEIKWTYRLDPPPPVLMAMELEPSFKSVFVRVKYNAAGTIKCLTKLKDGGEKPTQQDFDDQVQFWSQHGENKFATGTIEGLEEKTVYSIYCQATGLTSLTQNLIAVLDQERDFETKSKIPYCYLMSATGGISHKEITVEVLYSIESEVRCAAVQRHDGDFADATHRKDLKNWASVGPAKPFTKDPIKYELKGLIPDVPTHILCIARSSEKDGTKTRYYTQLAEDYWKYSIETRTPAMTNKELAKLTAEGCDLVPPFAPDRAVYACAVKAGTSKVKMYAEVDKGMYSQLECGSNWVTACNREVTISDDAQWTFHVKAQNGDQAKYVIVMITEPPVEPKVITPQILPAVSKPQNVTVCAVAKSNKLSQLTMDKTVAQLLPGPWDLPIQDIKTGSSLPTCKCAGCNVELVVHARGAGANLTFVIFVDGYPTFSLEDSMKVSFAAPEIADVVPPEASVYKDTDLIVYGSNFGGTNTTGAIINVMKVGPPKGLPAATWFAGCPILNVDIATHDPNKSHANADHQWVNWEFAGRYKLLDKNVPVENQRYEMSGERKIKLTWAQFQEIHDFNNDTVANFNCTEHGCKSAPANARRHLPTKVMKEIVYAVGLCCFKSSFDLLGFDGLYVMIRFPPADSRSSIRNMPSMRVIGNVWQINSNLIRQLRMHSESSNLRQESGWMVKYRPGERPPGAGEEQEAPGMGGRGGRRLSEMTADDELSESEIAQLKFVEELEAVLPALQSSGSVRPRALWETPPDGKNWTKNAKGQWSCAAGVDDNAAVAGLLKSLGYADMVPKARQNCELLKNSCAVARFICACTCEGYDPTPRMEELEKVTVECERCGDGIMVGWEKCDDGNLRDGDGCSRNCMVEQEFVCETPGRGPSMCKKEKAEEDSAKDTQAANLCGPTTWVDDSTLKCTLKGTSLDPLGLTVDVRGQQSVRGDWVQYVKPVIRSMMAGVVQVEAGSSEEWSKTVEFTGNQRLILNGRSLPPTQEEGAKHQLTMLIGIKGTNTSTILCSPVDVKSSTSFECQKSKPLDLNKVGLDSEVTIRVGEISSAGRTLSTLNLRLRQPEVTGFMPFVEEKEADESSDEMGMGRRLAATFEINDTDVKKMVLGGSSLGSADFGTLQITVAGSPCNATLHAAEKIECEIKYIPNGTWPVMMQLGNIPAVGVVNITVKETLCHEGNYRMYKEESDCAPCVAGTADPNVNALRACPDCADGMYQNDTGMTECKHCVANSFSVPNRSLKDHCRCFKGFYHAYGDAELAEKCTKCEERRGFGWSTLNMTIVNEAADPNAEEFYEYNGNCSEMGCYGYECSACPAGAHCFGNAAWPRVLPGFWAHNVFEDDATKIERCMPMEACLGDDGFGQMQCENGYEGIRCGVCELGFYKDQHICHKCPDNQWVFAMIFALFFLCVLFFGIIPALYLFMKRMLGIHSDLPWIWRCWFKCCCCITCCFKKGDGSEEKAPPGCCWNCLCNNRFSQRFWRWDAELGKAPLLRTLSMCLNFGHTCYAFAMLQRPAVAWPDPSWELLSWTKLLTIDVEFMKPDCVVPMPFFTKWVGKFFMPFGMFALLLLITCYLQMALKKEQAANRVEGRTKSSVWAVFRFSCALIVHIILIWHLKVALSPVDCNWCREGVTCLDEYTLVECWGDDPTWMKMMIISIIDFIFVSGFFPIFLSITIFRSWRASRFIDPNAPVEQGRQISFTSFFVTGYKDRFTGGNLFTYGWEVVVLFRKLTLIVSAKFTSTDPILGANIQLLVLLLSLVMQLTMRPYKADILCNIDNFLCVMLFLALLSACQLTMGGLGDMEGCYIALNVIALFGGAAIAILVCLRKLMYAYLNETSERNQALQAPKAILPMSTEGTQNDVKVMDVEDAPAEDVKKETADDQDSETAI